MTSVDQHYSVPHLAELLDMSERTILRAISRGELRAKRHAREYRVAATAINEWLPEVNTRVIPLHGRMMRATN